MITTISLLCSEISDFGNDFRLPQKGALAFLYLKHELCVMNYIPVTNYIAVYLLLGKCICNHAVEI